MYSVCHQYSCLNSFNSTNLPFITKLTTHLLTQTRTEMAEPPEFLSVETESHNFKRDHLPFPKRHRSSNSNTIQDRRVLRSHYLVIQKIIRGSFFSLVFIWQFSLWLVWKQLNLISITILTEEKEEICSLDSGRFQKIIGEVDRLHKLGNSLLYVVRRHSKIVWYDGLMLWLLEFQW